MNIYDLARLVMREHAPMSAPYHDLCAQCSGEPVDPGVVEWPCSAAKLASAVLMFGGQE